MAESKETHETEETEDQELWTTALEKMASVRAGFSNGQSTCKKLCHNICKLLINITNSLLPFALLTVGWDLGPTTLSYVDRFINEVDSQEFVDNYLLKMVHIFLIQGCVLYNQHSVLLL